MKNYGKFVYLYDLEKHILIKKGELADDSCNDILHNPKYALCFKIENNEDFMCVDPNISYNNFPWKTYYKINIDLRSKNIKDNTKLNAWNHWLRIGRKEERSFSFINNTKLHLARFGNLFFLNMCLHIFSQKFDLRSTYKYENDFNKLGIYFHKGNQIHKKNILLTDQNFENLLKSDISPRNIIINNNVWFHTNSFCKTIKEYFENNNLFINVRQRNVYRNKYYNNNDLFIHVRLGDVSDKTTCLKNYYIKTIESVKFDRGFISSDSLNHDLCKKLIKKYKLTPIDKSEVETIMFGSTCKNIILTGGTFSWLIGFLALPTSTIFYPELKDRWFGNIFSFTNWNRVTL